MIDLPKQALRWSGFKARGNHVGHLVGVAELMDAQGVTMPGYTLQIEIKAPVDTARCLFLFSIMRLHQKKRSRVTNWRSPREANVPTTGQSPSMDHTSILAMQSHPPSQIPA